MYPSLTGDLSIMHMNNPSLHTQGMIERDEGRLNDALTSLKRAMELNPKNSNNSKELGKTL